MIVTGRQCEGEGGGGPEGHLHVLNLLIKCIIQQWEYKKAGCVTMQYSSET